MDLTLDEQIRDVMARADDTLSQLEAASQRAVELGELGDALLNHFVDRSRRAGYTWTEIGQHLGVTRQAAQKRFVDAVGDTVTLERFTMRARRALDRAREVASSFNHNYVGTEHQLLALFDVEGGLAAKALENLSLTRKAVEKAIIDRVGKGPKAVSGSPPFTPRARKALQEAVKASLDLGHNYVGTEHLLLGLYRVQEGLAKQILERLGAKPDKVRAEVTRLLSGFQASSS
jgi:ABC-type transporter Mla subunit MlaD